MPYDPFALERRRAQLVADIDQIDREWQELAREYARFGQRFNHPVITRDERDALDQEKHRLHSRFIRIKQRQDALEARVQQLDREVEQAGQEIAINLANLRRNLRLLFSPEHEQLRREVSEGIFRAASQGRVPQHPQSVLEFLNAIAPVGWHYEESTYLRRLRDADGRVRLIRALRTSRSWYASDVMPASPLAN